jgi:hypothetical protein
MMIRMHSASTPYCGSRDQEAGGLAVSALVVDPEHADDGRFEGEGLDAGLGKADFL